MKRTISFLLVLTLVVALAVPVLAADISFAFNLSNSGQSFTTYTGGYNTKEYLSDPATIKCTTEAEGYGYKMHLVRKGGFLGLGWDQATDSYWYSGVDYLLHPSYLAGEAEIGENYYIAGRIDDSCAGPFSAYGLFNSDWRNI